MPQGKNFRARIGGRSFGLAVGTGNRGDAAVRMLRTADRQYKRYEQPRRCGPVRSGGRCNRREKICKSTKKNKILLANGRTGDKLVPMEIWKSIRIFAPGKVRTEGDVVHYALPCVPFDLYGIFYDEAEKQFARLPPTLPPRRAREWYGFATHLGRKAALFDRFDYFEVAAQYKMFEPYSHMPLSGRAVCARGRNGPCGALSGG